MSNTNPQPGWGASSQPGANAGDTNLPHTESTEQAQNVQNAADTANANAAAAQDATATQPLNAAPTQNIPDVQPDYRAASNRPADSTGYRAAAGYSANPVSGTNASNSASVNAANDANRGYDTANRGYDASNRGYAYGYTPAPGYGANPNPGFGTNPDPGFGANPDPGFGANGSNGSNGSEYRGGYGSGYGANDANPTAGNGSGWNGGPSDGGPEPHGTEPNDGNEPNGASTKTKRHASTVATAVIAALVAVALSLGIGFAALQNGWITVRSASGTTTTIKSSTGSDTGSSTQVADGSDWVTVAKSVNNSVVSILVTESGGSARGSGAILDTSGHVVTNNHVVSGAQSIYVTLSDGSMCQASVVGTDPTTDLAVLQMQNAPSGLTPITFADSDSLAVGESVMAIGNPLGLSNTTTTGIISALNRPVSTYSDDSSSPSSSSSVVVTNAIQIDAAINPGNSGGPTFNSAGQVIGINSSIATTSSSTGSSSSSGSIGIGFAIPSNLVKSVCDQIISSGSVTHVQLGVSISTQYVEYNNGYRAGAEVESVTSGSPAEKAGLQKGDLIIAYNGNLVNSSSSVLGYVRATKQGDTVTLTVIRNGQTQDIQVTMDQAESASGPSSSGGSSSNGNGNGGDGGGLYDPFGLFGNGNN